MDTRIGRWLRYLVAGAALAAVLSPASAAVVDSSPSGFTIENHETVPGDPGRAWRALVEDVGRWWPADHTWWGDPSRLSIQPRAGGCFCEIAGAQQAWHMTVSFVDPGRLLRMTGGLGPLQGMGLQGALEWRFEAVDDGTRIILFYRAGGYSPEDLGKLATVVDQVQASQLGHLAAFLRRAEQ